MSGPWYVRSEASGAVQYPCPELMDFLRAVALFQAGDAARVMLALMPLELDAEALHRRVHAMVVVGAVITGVPCAPASGAAGDEPAKRLAGRLTALGAELDAEGIRALIAAHCAQACRLEGAVDVMLVDALVELVERAGSLISGRPPVELPHQPPLPAAGRSQELGLS